MQASQIEFAKFSADHLQGALHLSRQANWPHRREDWAMVLSLSNGIVALQDGGVVGTIMVTPYGAAAATINMVIVDEAMRGCGIGRQLMDLALQQCEGRECRLIATEDGLPLYAKLGFAETGTILQYQGNAPSNGDARPVEWATVADLEACAVLDQQASGLDRTALMTQLLQRGRVALLRPAGAVVAFAGLREFGRGEVIGPVVAADVDGASRLVADLLSFRHGAFVRVDTTQVCGLGPWLQSQGLAHVGGGIAMRRHGRPPGPTPNFQTFALASQALG